VSREEHAHEAVQALVPDDTILDVALTYPRGFTAAQATGAALGSVAGSGSDFSGVGAALGTVVGGKLFANLMDMPESIVLAVSETAVYTMGRHTAGLVGGWDDLTPMVRFDRDKLHVDVHQGVVTLEITLTDTEHDVSLELEAKRLGSLDAKAIAELLLLSPRHTDPSNVDEDLGADAT
jgi:hypothetical protein